MSRLPITFDRREAGAQYYSVAVSDDRVLALGKSDGSVRWVDTQSTKRGAAPIKLPLPRTFWVEGLALGDGYALATSSIAHAVHRIELASGNVSVHPVHGAALGLSLRGNMVAIAAGNCVVAETTADTLERPSYCGLPWKPESYEAVALSPDADLVAAMACRKDWRACTDDQRLARFDLELFVGGTDASPPAAATRVVVPVAVRAGARLPALGWLGGGPALLEEQGLVRIEGNRAVRTPWPGGFRASAFAWATDHGVAIDAKGRLAIAHSSGFELTTSRAEVPWANIAVSPSGRWLAFAAGFSLSRVFDLGSIHRADLPAKSKSVSARSPVSRAAARPTRKATRKTRTASTARGRAKPK